MGRLTAVPIIGNADVKKGDASPSVSHLGKDEMAVNNDRNCVREAPQVLSVLSPRLTKWILLAVVLALAMVLIARGIRQGEFNLNTDESYDAFTGLFFADFLRQAPLAHPVQYTYVYYAHYPAIELLHWPPLFHVVEGIFFLLLGPSVLAARLAILMFALFGLFFWFKLVCELENEWTAAFATALLAVIPQVFLFEKAVMLEVPCLALSIAASYFWIRYLLEARNRFLYSFAILAGLALLTKQLSGYLALFCLLSAVTTHNWRRVVCWPIARALSIVLLLAGPFYALSLAVDLRSISGNVFEGASPKAHPYAFYIFALPKQVGWPVLALALLGVITWRWWTKRANVAIMVSWILACYCTAAVLATKDVRYTIYLAPALVYFATAALTSRSLSPKLRVLGSLAAFVLVAGYSLRAWRFQRPYVSGFAPAAEAVSQVKDSRIILYDGDLEANFMFFLRVHDPDRRFIVLRKALYVTAVMKKFGAQELIQNAAQLQDLIREYGIKYVMVEDPVVVEFDIQRTIRDVLNTPQFRLLQSFPITSNIPSLQGRRILLYENTVPTARSAEYLHIKMLTLSHDIVIPLGDGR